MARPIQANDWTPSGGIILEAAADRVVRSNDSRSVIAGPGSGKTELLAQRAVFLLQTAMCPAPRKVLAICFKRDAAKNLKDRVSRRSGAGLAARFDSMTFDAFAKGIVDRFLQLTPEWCRPPTGYHVLFPSKGDWDLFLRSQDPPAHLGGRRALMALARDKVEKWGPLPLILKEADTIEQWAAERWYLRLRRGEQPGLTFAMINQLALAILRHNPAVLRGLQLTYSHVFLDEFQDTTRSQWALVRQAFEGSDAVMTAVGDTNQRIMTWAGAEAEVFTWFEKRFRARREKLQINHRSNRRIVQIINDLIKSIEPDAVETQCARDEDPVPEDAAGFWIFDTDRNEARWLANLIANETKSGERQPHDFVIVARVKVDAIEKQLKSEFAKKGLVLRNDARALHGVPIQDLLADDYVLMMLGLIRLALGMRGHEIYARVQDGLSRVLGIDYSDIADVKRLEKAILGAMKVAQPYIAIAPSDADFRELIADITTTIGKRALQRAFRQFENTSYFLSVRTALAALMGEYSSGSWHDLIESVEGKGQVRLMTIHKSKGLEYHTVIFLGIHQNAFFDYHRNASEETNVFFVALSRARERVVFTRSQESGEVNQIKDLIGLLNQADVPFYDLSLI